MMDILPFVIYAIALIIVAILLVDFNRFLQKKDPE